MPKQQKTEPLAMERIEQALEGLTPQVQARVLAWAQSKYVIGPALQRDREAERQAGTLKEDC